MNAVIKYLIEIEKARNSFRSTYYYTISSCRTLNDLRSVQEEISLCYDYYILTVENDNKKIALTEDYVLLLKQIINKLLDFKSLENIISKQPLGYDEVDNPS